MNSDELNDRFQHAVVARRNREFATACNALRELVQANPESTTLLTLLGDCYWELGDMESAIATFQKAIRISPRCELASRGLFHCYWELNNEPAAFAEMRRFLSIASSETYKAIIQEL